MKKIFRTLAALTLVVMLAASLSAAAWADGEGATGGTETTKEFNATVTVKGLVDGEVVNAYKLIEYDTNYNTMTIIDSYKAYVKDKLGVNNDDAEDILSALSEKPAAGMLEGYLASTSSLPTPVTGTAVNNQVMFTFTPGYYLLTVATNMNADRLYRPMGVFVQPYGDTLHIYAGDVAVPTIGNSAELIAKSVAGTVIDKKVKDGDEWKTTATAGVGDTAEFYIEIIIPYYGGGSSITMTLTDTLEHMNYDVGSAKLYSTLNNGAFSDEIAGALTVDTTNGLEFTLNYDKLMTDAAADRTVYLRYTATVDQSAANGGVAKNEARLTYANAADPNNAKTTDSQIVKVYNYEFSLAKKNENGLTSLSGAEFTIYSDEACTNAISFVKTGNNYVKSTASGAVTAIPADFTVSGLAPGDYYVKETTTPRGYFAPAGIFKLTLTAAKDAGSTEYSGALDADNSSFTAVDEENDSGLVKNSGVVPGNPNRYSVSLRNVLTPVLPSTGGAGTVMFTVGGVAVMVLAAVLFLKRKREE